MPEDGNRFGINRRKFLGGLAAATGGIIGATGTASAAPSGTKVFELNDSVGDDYGPGSYTYPDSTDYHDSNGDDAGFDLSKFEVYDDGTTKRFVFEEANTFMTYGSEGFGTAVLGVFMHDPTAGTGSTVPVLPNGVGGTYDPINTSLDKEYHRFLLYNEFPADNNIEDQAVYDYTGTAKAGESEVSRNQITTARQEIAVDTSNVSDVFPSSLETYEYIPIIMSDSGEGRTPKIAQVQPSASSYNNPGGGTDNRNDPNIMDIGTDPDVSNSTALSYDANTFQSSTLPFVKRDVTVTTSGSSSVGRLTATLEGQVEKLRSNDVDVRFRYYPKGSPELDSFTPRVQRGSTGSFTADIFGLNPGTSYEFEAQLQELTTGRWDTGSTMTVTTNGLKISTDPIVSVSGSSATLAGTLDQLGSFSSADVRFKVYPEGSPNKAKFTSYSTKNSTGSYQQTINYLEYGGDYIAEAQAKAPGPRWETGGTVTFTTSGSPYAVSTGSAESETQNGATLNGTLDGLDGLSSADVRFKVWEQGVDPTPQNSRFTSYTTLNSPGSFQDTVPGDFATNTTNLDNGTTYVFEAQAFSNGKWRTASSTSTFTTLS